jgi:two-component system, NtrC family, response regulator
MKKLLVIDDCEEIRKQLRWGLSKDYRVLEAANVCEALETFRIHQPEVVSLDLGLPPNPLETDEGFRLMEGVLKEKPATKVVVVTGNEQRKIALKAIQMGAYDFYAKPIDLGELRVILNRAFHLYDLEQENRLLQSALIAPEGELFGLFGHCPAMQEVFRMVNKVAGCDVPVLVVGESGTGKELVARAIHACSLRRNSAFIPLNCGAIPETLLESELFGHEKGAFTGARMRVHGKVEYAHRGTLFLDEVAELALPLQVKLLRFLQEKVIQRVGGREDIVVDARIIAATNVDVQQAIREGGFREDLYYRVGVLTIPLPPLRERGGDIFLLANLFLRRFSEKIGKKLRGFTPSAAESLRSYSWPGNVRELENKIKRGVILAESAFIGPEELGLAPGAIEVRPVVPAGKLTLREARDRLEGEMVMAEIHRHSGNIARAAQALGVSRPTIYDLMKKHGFHPVSSS